MHDLYMQYNTILYHTRCKASNLNKLIIPDQLPSAFLRSTIVKPEGMYQLTEVDDCNGDSDGDDGGDSNDDDDDDIGDDDDDDDDDDGDDYDDGNSDDNDDYYYD